MKHLKKRYVLLDEFKLNLRKIKKFISNTKKRYLLFAVELKNSKLEKLFLLKYKTKKYFLEV
jgi:hypothetical protein